ncbi:HAD family hydrolase [Streptomyces sp. NPDC000963]|uniref:HAD family hydrolase n=1 Tax=Streptomyces sp. WAC08241 TaxID=2487421 RepID=UPI000F79801A|nr:haloacid dehalogenase-like hydrolase [Streptomyces sp. WAC08241]RSS43484.1 HAD family hydrolase [Streptomyces sp. WAC08241]
MQLSVLWDIDHTLIDNAGVSKEIYAAAFTALAGFAPNGPARTKGRTDRLIMREMLLRHGVPEPRWELVQAALERAGEDRFEELRTRGTALPGVSDALKAVAEHESWVSSVLTGNIAANARVKLAAFGLDPLVDLSVGAFGSDGVQRPELVAVARERVRLSYGTGQDRTIVLVGDTPRDIEAALSTGSHVIAVATGMHSQEELASAGAAIVLPDLADTAGLVRHLEFFAAR